MKPITYYVGGTSAGAGKTFVALGLLHILSQFSEVAAWKPIDVGNIVYNSSDQLTDGERLKQAGKMAGHINLVNPFLLNENLPPILAARRDGVRLTDKALNQYLDILCKKFDYIVIEGFRGLHSPITETSNELELLVMWKPKVLWVSPIGESALAETLLQIHVLKQAGIEVLGIILNNHDNTKNTELIHYQWNTLEEQLSTRVLALLPFLSTGLDAPNMIGKQLYDHFDKEYLHLLSKTS